MCSILRIATVAVAVASSLLATPAAALRDIRSFNFVAFANWPPDNVTAPPAVLTVADAERHGQIANGHLYVYWNDTIPTLGWAALRITAGPATFALDEPARWRLAGYVEGALSQARIAQLYANVVNPANVSTPSWDTPGVTAFLDTQIAFIEAKIATEGGPGGDPWWRRMTLLWAQLHGVHEGYASVAPPWQQLSFRQHFINNNQDDIDDVFWSTAPIGTPPDARKNLTLLRGGCSAIVRVTPDDLFVAHTTWGGYNSMTRVIKDFAFVGQNATAITRVAFSSYPGLLHSGDDWYQVSDFATGNRLAIQETTNGIFPDAGGFDRNRPLIVPATVPEWLRVMVAVYAAATTPDAPPSPSTPVATSATQCPGRAFAEAFGRYNSGTYNNQYMVVDFRRFVPGTTGASLPDGLLYVVEQMPGLMPFVDATPTLRRDGYWASYNRPYFSQNEYASSTYARAAAWGALFNYTTYARPVIFRREVAAGRVDDLAGVKRIIRYNEWTTDPASKCPGCQVGNGVDAQSCLTISCRGDLIPANATSWGKWAPVMPAGPGAFGAIDGKIAAYSLLSRGFDYAVISGPTHEQDATPPFRWSTSPVNAAAAHAGQPDLQQFPWVGAADLFPV